MLLSDAVSLFYFPCNIKSSLPAVHTLNNSSVCLSLKEWALVIGPARSVGLQSFWPQRSLQIHPTPGQ